MRSTLGHHRGDLHGPGGARIPTKRYTAAVSCGAIYVVIGLFGAAVTSVLLTAFPRELVVAVAGLTLLGSIAAGWRWRWTRRTAAAFITFLVTPGVTSPASAGWFWGVTLAPVQRAGVLSSRPCLTASLCAALVL